MARLRLLVAVGILLLGNPSFKAQAPPSQDEATIAKQLVGTWRLESWTRRFADGTTSQFPSVGYVIYTDTGHMCATIMNANRPKWKSDTGAPTPDEAASTIGNATDFAAYCSRVDVHAKEEFVLHHVEIEKSPNIVGRTRKRWFTFQGQNRLTLRVDPSENQAPVVESTLIWQHVQK